MDFGVGVDVENNTSITPDSDCEFDAMYERFLKSSVFHFKSEAAFRSWVRGGLRLGLWKNHPVKTELLKIRKIRIKNPNPNPRKGAETIWGYVCNDCGCECKAADISVDHIDGENSFKSVKEIQSFFMRMVLVTTDDLQILCNPCHDIKTYMERYQVSKNKAKAVKKAKAVMKGKRHVSVLASYGYTAKMTLVKSEEVLVSIYEKEYESSQDS